MSIPFNKPVVLDDSYIEIKKSLKSGRHSGRGPYSKKCQDWLINRFPEISSVHLSTSCTHALEASAILLDLSRQDEVIVPSYTFVTSALSYYMHGASLRFCDIRPDTLNIDEKKLENHISDKTKAIVVIHYAGVSCEMDEIMKIAAKYNLYVIEDNAHGLFGKYKGNSLGTFGDFSTLSFHETKNINCGEGGALFIRDQDFTDRADMIFEKGTNRSQFINGLVDKYSWFEKGSSYILSDLLASLLYVQLINANRIQVKRETLWNKYFSSLSDWSKENNVNLPFIPSYCDQTFHMFYMLFPNKDIRNIFIEYMSKNDISCVFHYLPLDSSMMGARIKLNESNDCPISREISDCILRLPLYFDLTNTQQERIIETIIKFKV